MWCEFIEVYISCNILGFIISDDSIINFCLCKFCVYKLIVFIDINSDFKKCVCVFIYIEFSCS